MDILYALMNVQTKHYLRSSDNRVMGNRDGKLKPAKVTEGGTRYYSEYQLNSYLGKPLYARERLVLGYARVSTHSQKDDLERQIENIKTYMYAKVINLRW